MKRQKTLEQGDLTLILNGILINTYRFEEKNYTLAPAFSNFVVDKCSMVKILFPNIIISIIHASCSMTKLPNYRAFERSKSNVRARLLIIEAPK